MDMPTTHTSSCAWTLPLLETVAIVLDTYTTHSFIQPWVYFTLCFSKIHFHLILRRQRVCKKPEEFVLQSLDADFKRKQPCCVNSFLIRNVPTESSVADWLGSSNQKMLMLWVAHHKLSYTNCLPNRKPRVFLLILLVGPLPKIKPLTHTSNYKPKWYFSSH